MQFLTSIGLPDTGRRLEAIEMVRKAYRSGILYGAALERVISVLWDYANKDPDRNIRTSAALAWAELHKRERKIPRQPEVKENQGVIPGSATIKPIAVGSETLPVLRGEQSPIGKDEVAKTGTHDKVKGVKVEEGVVGILRERARLIYAEITRLSRKLGVPLSPDIIRIYEESTQTRERTRLVECIRQLKIKKDRLENLTQP